MRPDLFQLIGYGSLILLLLYVAFFVRKKRAGQASTATTKDMIEANTEALKENSLLLRELIGLNRRILEKQDRTDA